MNFLKEMTPESSVLERSRVEAFHLQHQAIDNEVNGLHMIQLREPVPAIFNTKHPLTNTNSNDIPLT